MAKINFKKISYEFIKKNYPLLFNSIETIDNLSYDQKEKVAGLCVEVLMKCKGDVIIFQDDLDLDLQEDEY